MPKPYISPTSLEAEMERLKERSTMEGDALQYYRRIEDTEI
jgi:hypothetical protein